MLDHFLVDLISAIRRSFDDALLQRQALEERFQVDVFLGDVSWETSYSLPGEVQPPRVRADLSVDWPTWSQTAYRSWSIGESPHEPIEAVIEVAMRVQRLAQAPTSESFETVFKIEAPGEVGFGRSALTIEHAIGVAEEDSDAASDRWAVEATYEGSWRFDDADLEDPSAIEPTVKAFTNWISSTLVQLADLPLEFLTPNSPD